jgi:endogenous inhibitor of DNA gyrase (YacG/DUF329 family)
VQIDDHDSKRKFACTECGRKTARRASSHKHFFCSARCRLRAFRRRQSIVPCETPVDSDTVQFAREKRFNKWGMGGSSGKRFSARKTPTVSTAFNPEKAAPSPIWIGPDPGYLSNLRSGFDLDRKLNARHLVAPEFVGAVA